MWTERISEIYQMFHLGFFYFIGMYWNIQNTDTCQSSGNKDRERKLEHTPKHTDGANINSLPCEMIGQHNERGTPDILFYLKASFAHVGDETFQIAGLRSNSRFFKEGVISVGWILCWGKVTFRTHADLHLRNVGTRRLPIIQSVASLDQKSSYAITS